MQQAIGAPVPEQLEEWANTGRDPIPLPLTNDSLSKWRDQRRVYYSADFDPKKLATDRLKEQRLMHERVDKMTTLN